MTAHINHSGFEGRRQVYGLGKLLSQETVIRAKIAEFTRLTDILAVEPWTEHDVQGMGLDNRLRNLFERGSLEKSSKYQFIGTDRFREGGGDIDDRDESPFWVCAEAAKSEVMWCLSVHLGRMRMVPSAVLLVSDEGLHGLEEVPLPSDHTQVHVVFPLATLLYATFNIPVPPRPTQPGLNLWSLLTCPTGGRPRMFGGHGNVIPAAAALHLSRVPVFECLDLENDAQWCTRQNKDTHGLKRNLRNNVFYIPAGSIGTPTMPWTSDTQERTVLKELVGYSKYIQSVHARPGSFDPLASVQSHCASCMRKLQQELLDNTHNLQDLMLHNTPAAVESVEITPAGAESLAPARRCPSVTLQEMRACLVRA
jgi:hypothetical protein